MKVLVGRIAIAFARFSGIEHGIFEVLRGNTRPDGLMTQSIGPPCDPATIWHACEPTMTILPNFLATGLIAIALGTATMIWAMKFNRHRYFAPSAILLSIALLAFGGGIVPPLIGMFGAVIVMLDGNRAQN